MQGPPKRAYKKKTIQKGKRKTVRRDNKRTDRERDSAEWRWMRKQPKKKWIDSENNVQNVYQFAHINIFQYFLAAQQPTTRDRFLGEFNAVLCVCCYFCVVFVCALAIHRLLVVPSSFFPPFLWSFALFSSAGRPSFFLNQYRQTYKIGMNSQINKRNTHENSNSNRKPSKKRKK